MIDDIISAKPACAMHGRDMFHVRSFAFFGVLMVAGAADARSHRVGPDPCPAPADVAAFVPDRDATISEFDASAYVDGPVLLDVRLTARPEGRLFKRFVIGSRSGRIAELDGGTDGPCR